MVLPAFLIPDAIKMAHEGHLGPKMCLRLLKEYYYFPNLERLVHEHIDGCEACDSNTDTTRMNPILSSSMPKEKWDLVAIDFSSRTPTGDYVLVLVCEHSRYPVLKLAKNLTSSETIKILRKVFTEFGVPRSIKSDNGPAFKSAEFSRFCKELRIAHAKVTPLWPRANSICERFMRNLNKVIRCANVTKTSWKISLEQYLKNYRACPHGTTGVTPNQLMGFENDNGMFSNNRNTNIDYKSLAFENDHAAKLIQKQYADKYCNTKLVEFLVNDIVKLKWDRSHSKYTPLLSEKNYIVTQVKGSMVTASSKINNKEHTVTRNSSFFKLATAGEIPIIMNNSQDENDQEGVFDLLNDFCSQPDVSDQHIIDQNDSNQNDNDQNDNDQNDNDQNDNDLSEQTYEQETLIQNDLNDIFSIMYNLETIVSSYDEQNDSDFMTPVRSPISEDYSTDETASDNAEELMSPTPTNNLLENSISTEQIVETIINETISEIVNNSSDVLVNSTTPTSDSSDSSNTPRWYRNHIAVPHIPFSGNWAPTH